MLPPRQGFDRIQPPLQGRPSIESQSNIGDKKQIGAAGDVSRADSIAHQKNRLAELLVEPVEIGVQPRVHPRDHRRVDVGIEQRIQPQIGQRKPDAIGFPK